MIHPLSRHALALAAIVAAAPAFAQISFYEHEGFDGRTFTTQAPVDNLERYGFSDRASSAVVRSERWEVCDDAGFQGHCVVLRPGQYPSLAAMGLNDRVTSVRRIERDARLDDQRYAPPPRVEQDYRRWNDEPVYTARVTSVRAVVGTAGRHCWVERGEVAPERGGANVPGAVVGAVIGGILGHQVGGGSGRSVATVGGAVVGAAVGANVGRDRAADEGAGVERCSGSVGDARPDYWDVSYEFRGQVHRVQMTTPPGETLTVNADGEPRV